VSNDDLSLLDDALRRRIRDGEVDIVTSFREKLEMLAVLAELRDDATGEHAYRVGKLAAIVGRRAGMDDQGVEDIEIAARLHDLGKLAVPDVVLQKRARLSPAELDVMRQHALEGYQILSAIGHPLFGLAGTIAWAHHEWWDGSGYPRGLRRTDIPESARITALADVFDALTHERPYKRAWPVKIAIEEIVSLSGSQFDPELCAHFLQVINELLAEHGGHLDAFLAQGASDSKLVSATRLIERAALLGRFPTGQFDKRS